MAEHDLGLMWTRAEYDLGQWLFMYFVYFERENGKLKATDTRMKRSPWRGAGINVVMCRHEGLAGLDSDR